MILRCEEGTVLNYTGGTTKWIGSDESDLGQLSTTWIGGCMWTGGESRRQ